jgi:hypothetical protein
MTYSSEQLEALQNAVDRVGAYWDGATEDTVEVKLREALSEVGVDVPDDDATKLADAIESEHGTVDVSSVLGG